MTTTKAQLKAISGGRSVAGVLPPHDLQAERALLSECLFRGCFPEAFALGLREDHFFDQKWHARIYQAARELDAEGATIEITLLASRLRDRFGLGRTNGTGLAAALGNLSTSEAVVSVPEVVERIMALADVRELIGASHEMMAEGYHHDWGAGGTRAWVRRFAHRVASIAERGERRKMATAAEAVGEAMQEVGRLITRSVQRPTGFSRLDWLVGGLGDEAILVVGKKKAGKSTWCRQVAINLASAADDDGELRNGVLIVSLEMPREQIALMGLAQIAKVPFADLRLGQTTDREAAERAAGTWKQLPVIIDDRGNDGEPVTARLVFDLAREAKRRFEARDKRLALVVVDLVQELHTGDEKRYFALDAAGRFLRKLPRRLECSFLVVSHTNSKGEPLECPALLGHLHGLWSIKRDKRPHGEGDGEPFVLTVENMRTTPREQTPCGVPLVGYYESGLFIEDAAAMEES